MNNNELLILGNAVYGKAYTKNIAGHDYVMIRDSFDTELQFLPKINSRHFSAVFEWLYRLGNLYIDGTPDKNNCVEYELFIDRPSDNERSVKTFATYSDNIKTNIGDIALQAAKYLNETTKE